MQPKGPQRRLRKLSCHQPLRCYQRERNYGIHQPLHPLREQKQPHKHIGSQCAGGEGNAPGEAPQAAPATQQRGR